MDKQLGYFQRVTSPETPYEKQSKQRLLESVTKKIRTTMIGALDELEKEFGNLWGKNKNGVLTESELAFKKKYDVLRSKILDRGNNQIRNAESELTQYNVKWNRYQIELKVQEGNNESTKESSKD